MSYSPTESKKEKAHLACFATEKEHIQNHTYFLLDVVHHHSTTERVLLRLTIYTQTHTAYVHALEHFWEVFAGVVGSFY